MDEHQTYDDAFESVRQEAAEAISDLVGELCKRHDMHAAMVIRLLHGSLELCESYMMGAPEVCDHCGCVVDGPLGGEFDDDDDDEDEIDKVPVE